MRQRSKWRKKAFRRCFVLNHHQKGTRRGYRLGKFYPNARHSTCCGATERSYASSHSWRHRRSKRCSLSTSGTIEMGSPAASCRCAHGTIATSALIIICASTIFTSMMVRLGSCMKSIAQILTSTGRRPSKLVIVYTLSLVRLVPDSMPLSSLTFKTCGTKISRKLSSSQFQITIG